MFASSSSVYGRSPDLPFKEGSRKIPVSPYGVSKLAAENYVRVYSEIYGIPTVSLRYFTVYGPRMRPDLAISIFTRRALKGEKIKVFGDGEQTRDFTYIEDIVDAQNLCLERKVSDGEAYNIGSGESISVNELVDRIRNLTESDCEVVHTQQREGDARHTWADVSNAEKELGWEPVYDLGRGLEEFIEWFRNVV